MMNVTCPDGHPIHASLETLVGEAEIDTFKRTPDGGLKVRHEGYTQIDWDSQKPVLRKGERVFVCTEGKEWRESKLVVDEPALTR